METGEGLILVTSRSGIGTGVHVKKVVMIARRRFLDADKFCIINIGFNIR
ncbi:hypothetical protein [Photorhabdus tasmaniensis]|nr:hypothetical protein [Photorhabdus tasmaniensis]